MNHIADKTKLPKSLESLAWEPRDDADFFEDGDRLLVAVPVCGDCHKPDGDWHYELCVVTVHCDSEYFVVDVYGDPWGWDMTDVEWFVRL